MVPSQRAQDFIQNVCLDYPKYNHINAIHYENQNVKRGLRNADGTGVLAGITKIGSVRGYIVEDGERVPTPGQLIYRGINIYDLVDGFVKEGRFGFEETCYLLLFGHLPTADQLDQFRALMEEMSTLPEHFTEDMILKAPSPDVMNKLGRCVLAMYSYDNNADEASLTNLVRQSMQLIARMPILVSHAFAVKRHYYDHQSLFLHYMQPGLSIAENLLQSLRIDNQYTEEEARLLDICLVLHAEHGGGNNSAFTCRVLTSSGTDTYAAISGAIGSLKGPRHGGANNRVTAMFEYIKENLRDWTDDEEITQVLTKIIRKEGSDGSGLIYGMGHAVYTVSDPRATILKKFARELAPSHGMEKEFALMESVERLTPVVFKKIKGDTKIISANVDMYSGLVYKMLGIPQELFTPIFALARTVGWCAHRIEEVMSGGRIIRPAYRSVATDLPYVPLSERV